MIRDSRGNEVTCPPNAKEKMKPVVNRAVTTQSPQGNDCLLHTCANAALSADGRSSSATASLDKDLLGKELRARMVIMHETGRFMFDAPGCPDLELAINEKKAVVDLVSGDDDTEGVSPKRPKGSFGGQASVPTEVTVKKETAAQSHAPPPREVKMEALEKMRKSLAKSSKSKANKAAPKKASTSRVEGWHFIRSTGKKGRGKDPTCAACKKPVSRAHSSRIFRFVRYKTKVAKANHSKTVVLHCRKECVAGLTQPKELSHLKGVCTKAELLNNQWEEGHLERNLDLKRVLEACKEGS